MRFERVSVPAVGKCWREVLDLGQCDFIYTALSAKLQVGARPLEFTRILFSVHFLHRNNFTREMSML